jgi:hypothetical protein
MPEPETTDALQEEAEIGNIRHPKKRAFLAALANTANVLRAAEIAGIDRDNHYLWLKKDPEYAAAFEIAWERAVDALEAEAARRAFEGIAEPVFHGGRRAVDVVVGKDGKVKIDPATGKPTAVPATIRKYSDTLLMFLLNGNRSAKYRQRGQAEENGRFVGTTIQLVVLPAGADPSAGSIDIRAMIRTDSAPALPAPGGSDDTT